MAVFPVEMGQELLGSDAMFPGKGVMDRFLIEFIQKGGNTNEENSGH
jgi:hypothetical protein